MLLTYATLKLRYGAARDGKHIQPFAKFESKIQNQVSIEVFSTFSSYLLKGSYLERATVNLRIITSDCDGLKVICKICITRRGGRKEERSRGGLKGACTTPLILPEAFQYLYRICCITSFVLSAGNITLLPRYSLFKFV